MISITCKFSTLTDIYDQLADEDILNKETSDGVWLLNAGIVIEPDSKLVIDAGDTKWLKILAGAIRSNNAGKYNSDVNSGDDDEDSVHSCSTRKHDNQFCQDYFMGSKSQRLHKI